MQADAFGQRRPMLSLRRLMLGLRRLMLGLYRLTLGLCRLMPSDNAIKFTAKKGFTYIVYRIQLLLLQQFLLNVCQDGGSTNLAGLVPGVSRASQCSVCILAF